MKITIQQLIAAGINPTQAKQFAGYLSDACEMFAINTPVRVAAFVAQCAHESAGFTTLEECLFYRTPERIREVYPSRVPTLSDAASLCRNPQALANRVYSNKNGNGTEESGDGWSFRGRGLIQITGRAGYALISAMRSGLQDYTSVPDLVAQPSHACLTSAYWWQQHGCNELADSSQIDAITRVVNGPAMVGALARRENFREAMVAFNQPTGATA